MSFYKKNVTIFKIATQKAADDEGGDNIMTDEELQKVNSLPDEYRPISMWGYFGYELLFSIPCVGLILLIVFSVGGTKNVNLKNFARSYFCFIILVAVIVAVLVLLAGGFAAFLS